MFRMDRGIVMMLGWFGGGGTGDDEQAAMAGR